MEISYAQEHDFETLQQLDGHISSEVLLQKINNEEILIAKNKDGLLLGFLRYNYFWDSIPFMNMLQIIPSERRKGLGRKLVTFWEVEMEKKGHTLVLTSTQSDEDAQHFYRKLHYKEKGSFVLPNEPLEIIFGKTIVKKGC
jgi:ribosomal protein S18 acetylase RimI-like enzyme